MTAEKKKKQDVEDATVVEENENSQNKSGTGEKEQTEDEKAKTIGYKITELADKGVAAAKEVLEKVKDFTSDATELTKLKVDIYKLKSERDKKFKAMGEKLWQLKKEDKFRGIQKMFTSEFEQLEILDKNILSKEEEAKNIDLSI